MPLEGVTAERFAFAGEGWVGVEDAQAAADHHHERHRVHPVGDPHDHVIPHLDRHDRRPFCSNLASAAIADHGMLARP